MRIIRILLALTLIASICCVGVGCGNSTSDLGGYEFVIDSPWLFTTGITTHETILKKRVDEVQEELNCVITVNTSSGNRQERWLAGDKIGDWIDNTTYNIISWAAGGYLVPYEDIKEIDLEDDRWVQQFNELFDVDGKTYGVNIYRPPHIRNVLYVNFSLLKECGVTDDIYELVRNNEWTFDKFREICQKVTNESEGIFGLRAYDNMEIFSGFISANGGKIADYKDGKVVEGTTSKEVVNALNYLYSLYNEYKVVYVTPAMRDAATFGSATAGQATIANDFMNGQFAFYYADTWVSNQLIKPLEPDIEWGMVPLPMGPNATSYSSSSFGANGFAVSVNNKDLDKAAVVMNALAESPEGYEGEDWWADAVVNDYLQDGDTEGYEMYKICLDNLTYDYVRTSGMDDLWGEFVLECGLKPIYFKTTSVASAVQSFEGIPTNRLSALFGIK